MRVIVVFILVVFVNNLTAQKLNYGIYLFGKKIGVSTIERKRMDDTTLNYTLNSASETTIFFVQRKVSLVYNITYRNDKLFSSYSKNIRNDEVITVQVNQQHGGYSIVRNNCTQLIKSMIDCSSVKFYFEEPCNDDKIFSERIGQFVPIRKISEGEYECTLNEGVTNIYRYKNGKLTELEIKKGMVSAYLRL
jgi:hypothetical protein